MNIVPTAPPIGHSMRGSYLDGQSVTLITLTHAESHAGYIRISLYCANGALETARPVAPEFVERAIEVLCEQADVNPGAVAWRAPEKMATRVSLSQSIYFVSDGLGHIKIGHARDVASRVTKLQTANSTPLCVIGTMPGGISDEKALHAKFASHRIRGEWFMPAPELLAYIKEHAK